MMKRNEKMEWKAFTSVTFYNKKKKQNALCLPCLSHDILSQELKGKLYFMEG